MKRFVILLVGVLCLALAGCGSKAPATVAAGSAEIQLRGMSYQPRTLTVKAGTSVTFINQDAMVHDVTQIAVADYGKKAPGFQSPPIQPGERWSHTFDKPGTYPVLCSQSAHYTAGMTATITVVP